MRNHITCHLQPQRPVGGRIPSPGTASGQDPAFAGQSLKVRTCRNQQARHYTYTIICKSIISLTSTIYLCMYVYIYYTYVYPTLSGGISNSWGSNHQQLDPMIDCAAGRLWNITVNLSIIGYAGGYNLSLYYDYSVYIYII